MLSTGSNIPFLVPMTVASHAENGTRFLHLLAAFQPDIICDIGALDSRDSIRMKRISQNSKVYAFEANPDNYFQFKGKNEFDDLQISYENIGIYSRRDQLTFSGLQTDQANSSDMPRRGAGSFLLRNRPELYASHQVQVMPLDEYFDLQTIATSTFVLWIDVEGTAYDVLVGCRSVLRRSLAVKVEVEMREIWQNQKTAVDVRHLMQEMGFIEMCNSGADTGQFDIIFLNKMIGSRM